MCSLGNVIKVVQIPEEKALIAHRSWGVNLTPLVMSRKRTRWYLNKTVKAHAKPTPKNSAGLYAYKSSRYRPPCFYTCGTIKVWGEVVIHERGYRASRAKIVRITKGHEYLPQSKKPQQSLNIIIM